MKIAPLGGPLITKTTVTAAILTVLMAGLILYRFVFGLGAVTNLNNGYPFGLWIVYDLVIGTAFACGGYGMALLVYVLNKGEYHALVRPALLASMFGYTLGGVSVIFDIGRWWNAWHIITPGWANPTSVMFEVGACITLYCLVMWIEFTPAFLEKWAPPKSRKALGKVMYVFIALGVLLPTMHQSSLGTLLVPFGFRLHPLWQTHLLPPLFLISALCMGYAMVVFEATLVSKAYRRPSEADLLARLSKYISGLLVAYLALRWGGLAVEGKLALAFDSGGLSTMFLFENLLFALPILLLSSDKGRRNPQTLFIAAVCMLLAGSLYRLDAFLLATDRPGWHYFPAIGEILVSVGIVAVEVLAYVVFVKMLPVLEVADEGGPVLHTVKRADLAATTQE